jgi:hypothetical protein
MCLLINACIHIHTHIYIHIHTHTHIYIYTQHTPESIKWVYLVQLHREDLVESVRDAGASIELVTCVCVCVCVCGWVGVSVYVCMCVYA